MNNSPQYLICFSHLRWDFVFQRPQHILSRFAKNTNVYFFEEPIFDAEGSNYLHLAPKENHLTVVTPHLRSHQIHELTTQALTFLLDAFLEKANVKDWTFWYYTPMALEFSDKYRPKLVVYDCMDELAAFKFAPPQLTALEQKLMERADLVLTGGHSLYEAKKDLHHNIYPMPSSIDKAHFAQARKDISAPADQAKINGPKIGFYGVIDERFDLELIDAMAKARPDWQLMIIGPVVKIDPNTLPQHPNIHYLGQKCYDELPAYLSGWDVALIPFLINESTRFISPTKTPEYLAAGIPVASSPIRDVIYPYGVANVVHICQQPSEFIAAVDNELNKNSEERNAWLTKVDTLLKDMSWDQTYATIYAHMQDTVTTAHTTISIAS